MEHELTFRQRVLSVLAWLNDLGHKEIGSRIGRKSSAVADLMRRFRQSEIKDEDYEEVLPGVTRRSAERPIAEGFVESLDALRQDKGLSEEEQTWVAVRVRNGARLLWEYCTALVQRFRTISPEEDYPRTFELLIVRRLAEEQFAELQRLPPPSRLAVVRFNKDYQSWALLERCCEASVEEVSRSLWRAASWARLALAISKFVRGPEDWRSRNRGYAFAHWANILKVRGELKVADSCLERAKRLWLGGADPCGVFDPGRLLDIEGSLRRDQRRFDEALFAFDRARTISRFPERALMMKGTTYDVMGDHERAISTFIQAGPLVECRGDPRLVYAQRFNLAVNLTHVGKFTQAAELLQQARDLAASLGDDIIAARVRWLEGRILAGLGCAGDALRMLTEARQRFAAEKMFYDVALALLEEAVLLLVENRTDEVKALTLELTKVFESKGVHREALAALHVFQKAAESEAASAELASRVLRFLFRARHDRVLVFDHEPIGQP